MLVIGTLGQLVNCGVGSVGYLLLMSGHQRRLIRIQAVMACVMMALNVAPDSETGESRAPRLAPPLTNAISNIWYLREVRRKFGLFPYNRSYLAAAASVGRKLWRACCVLRLTSRITAPEWIVIAAGLSLAYLVFIASCVGVRSRCR